MPLNQIPKHAVRFVRPPTQVMEEKPEEVTDDPDDPDDPEEDKEDVAAAAAESLRLERIKTQEARMSVLQEKIDGIVALRAAREKWDADLSERFAKIDRALTVTEPITETVTERPDNLQEGVVPLERPSSPVDDMDSMLKEKEELVAQIAEMKPKKKKGTKKASDKSKKIKERFKTPKVTPKTQPQDRACGKTPAVQAAPRWR